MNGLILELTNELKTNPEIKDSAVVRVVLESINNSALLGVPSDKILETALTTLDELGATTSPTHRALDDARATVDVLHGIIERLGSFGITTLPQFKKVKKRLVSG